MPNNCNEHFSNIEVINFDIINHKFKGKPLENLVEYYKIIFKIMINYLKLLLFIKNYKIISNFLILKIILKTIKKYNEYCNEIWKDRSPGEKRSFD